MTVARQVTGRFPYAVPPLTRTNSRIVCQRLMHEEEPSYDVDDDRLPGYAHYAGRAT